MAIWLKNAELDEWQRKRKCYFKIQDEVATGA